MKPIFSEYFYSFLGLWVGPEQSKYSLMLPIDSREYPICGCVICVKFIFDHTHPYRTMHAASSSPFLQLRRRLRADADRQL